MELVVVVGLFMKLVVVVWVFMKLVVVVRLTVIPWPPNSHCIVLNLIMDLVLVVSLFTELVLVVWLWLLQTSVTLRLRLSPVRPATPSTNKFAASSLTLSLTSCKL